MGGHTGPATKKLFSKNSICTENTLRKTSTLCLLALLSLVSIASSQAQQTGEPEKTVAAQEQQWLKSRKTNNPDLVAPLLADKFVSTRSDGKVTNKAESLASAKASKYVSAEYEDVLVTVFVNTAITTGAFKAT